MRARMSLVGGLTAVAVAMAACGDGDTAQTPAENSVGDCPTKTSAPLAVVIGARANSAVPVLPADLGGLLNDTAGAGQRIVLVRLDGNPEPVLDAAAVLDGANDGTRDDQLGAFLDLVAGAFSAKAIAPEADVLAALSLAGRSTGPGSTIVVLDSGLQTTAPLDFRKDDLLLAQPGDVKDYLAKEELLPDLAGRTLLLVGMGNTADPQPRLDDHLRRNLVDIWTAVGEGSGACVQAVLTGAAQHSVPGVPPVGVVALPEPVPPPDRCGDIVLSEENNVGFTENTTDFRDEAAARAEIGSIVDRARDGGQRIEVLGTTARWGSREGQVDLSRRRAERVKQIMVEQGIAEERISTDGEGSYSSFYVPDGGPDALVPGPAGRNRRVIVQLICP